MDYKNGKVYAIRSYETKDIYIGSTCQPLRKRLYEHRNAYKRYKARKYHYVTSYELIKRPDHYIELIELCPCASKIELRRREGELIRTHNCINKVVPCRTNKEYRADNKESISLKHKQYRADNKEAITVRKKQYYEKNKESIREKRKEYRADNKEAVSRTRKQYYEKNKESLKLKNKQYRADNKEAIAVRRKQYYIEAKQRRRMKKSRDACKPFKDKVHLSYTTMNNKEQATIMTNNAPHENKSTHRICTGSKQSLPEIHFIKPDGGFYKTSEQWRAKKRAQRVRRKNKHTASDGELELVKQFVIETSHLTAENSKEVEQLSQFLLGGFKKDIQKGQNMADIISKAHGWIENIKNMNASEPSYLRVFQYNQFFLTPQ